MQKYVIALYIRLSIEDYKYDSLSIENQSLVLHEYAASMPEALNAEIMEFIDNGYSGTNFERPQVQKLIELVRANQIDCIIVKDFSRFGRNSIETGYFIERVFPLFHTRFISISDDFDSSKFKGDTGGMDVAFKYLISEYYSRDMSIKTKSAKYAKMQRGEYQSKMPLFSGSITLSSCPTINTSQGISCLAHLSAVLHILSGESADLGGMPCGDRGTGVRIRDRVCSGGTAATGDGLSRFRSALPEHR